eukprot:scaffold3425_cov107-Isochrysis_galbana.AAC.3
MQSDGGLAPAGSFSGFRAVLSGPAGGYIGYARTAYTEGGPPVIGFDMGGTSTDVSRYAGTVEQARGLARWGRYGPGPARKGVWEG